MSSRVIVEIKAQVLRSSSVVKLKSRGALKLANPGDRRPPEAPRSITCKPYCLTREI
ncbi:hypothetical protein TIFTF001_022380 [Ficus carica]|uniref:Uncharacterized protein n=1 Tax=Ficus carica TaxID=3494 RepID=A0AA88AJU3_FICCA|nr:hypothetical protein TIFTF001_022380 [Ficus carica]